MNGKECVVVLFSDGYMGAYAPDPAKGGNVKDFVREAIGHDDIHYADCNNDFLHSLGIGVLPDGMKYDFIALYGLDGAENHNADMLMPEEKLPVASDGYKGMLGNVAILWAAKDNDDIMVSGYSETVARIFLKRFGEFLRGNPKQFLKA